MRDVGKTKSWKSGSRGTPAAASVSDRQASRLTGCTVLEAANVASSTSRSASCTCPVAAVDQSAPMVAPAGRLPAGPRRLTEGNKLAPTGDATGAAPQPGRLRLPVTRLRPPVWPAGSNALALAAGAQLPKAHALAAMPPAPGRPPDKGGHGQAAGRQQPNARGDVLEAAEPEKARRRGAAARRPREAPPQRENSLNLAASRRPPAVQPPPREQAWSAADAMWVPGRAALRGLQGRQLRRLLTKELRRGVAATWPPQPRLRGAPTSEARDRRWLCCRRGQSAEGGRHTRTCRWSVHGARPGRGRHMRGSGWRSDWARRRSGEHRRGSGWSSHGARPGRGLHRRGSGRSSHGARQRRGCQRRTCREEK